MRMAAAGACRSHRGVCRRRRKEREEEPSCKSVMSTVQSRMHVHRDRGSDGEALPSCLWWERVWSPQPPHRCHRRLEDFCQVREKRHLSGLLGRSLI